MIEPDMLVIPGRSHDKVTLRGHESLENYSRPWRLVPHKKAGFHATVQTWHSRRLLLSRAQGDAIMMYRDAEHLRDGHDRFLLMVLVHEGGLTCEQRGRMTTASQGSIVTLLPKETFWSSAMDGTDATLLFVPVGYLEERGIGADVLAAAAWHGGPLLEGIRALVDRTLELPEDQREQHAIHVEQALLELLVGLIAQYLQSLGSHDAAAEEVRRRVASAIANNYANPSYNVASIAAELGVSRRYLYKVYEGRETSVGALLRSKRLDEAEILLRRQDFGPTLSRIGKSVGFTSAESFGRSFKDRTGTTPSEYRARHKTHGTRRTAD
ncbi:AraC-type DNA-binding protein [Arthrobacter alpinus]|uniref:AraC-type DNA-binding protein n=1 Tax=Arthrobacter alpinus TaxID=656366 RepID=A0A1H5NFM8_9MICC|nr:AraC family transcriptional regulator [Arthrobacter alpinus]SEF00355.1 AraC-type DNA-binding protein [Arthrobacter alpinus]